MKKLIILLFLLLITGCKAKYDLKINFDGTVIESGSIYINSNLLGKDNYPSNTKEFLEKVASDYKFSNYHSKSIFDEGDYIGYNFSHKYSNIKRYVNQSPAIKALYGGLTVKENNHYVIIQANGENKISNYHNLKKDVPTVVENISISITLPYRVVKNNATRVDTESNTYTWIFNGTSFSNINLEYRDNELYTTDFINLLKFIGWYIYVIVIFIVIGLVVIFNIKSASKFRNKI